MTDILDAVRRTNLIDSPGLLEQNHQLYLALVNGQVARSRADRRRSSSRPRQREFRCASATWRRSRQAVKPVYTIVTANGKPAVLLNINRQPDSNTVAVADEVHAEIRAHPADACRRAFNSQPFYDQSEIVTESIKSVRDAILIGLVLASHHHGRCSCATGALRWSPGW